MNQNQPLLLAISHTLKRFEIPHQVESGEPFSAHRNLRLGIAVRRGDLRDALHRKKRDKSILLDVAHAHPLAQVHLLGGSAGHVDQLPLPHRRNQHYARPGHVSFAERSHKRTTFVQEMFGRLEIGGRKSIDQAGGEHR